MVSSSPSRACLDDNDVARLLDCALPPAEHTRVEQHLDDCASCTELVAELARALAPDRAAPAGYRLVRALGDTTWEADDPEGQRVHLSFGVTCDPRLVALRHPHVVDVRAIGELDGESFVASAPVGQTFRAWQAAREASPAQLVTMWCDALDGLTALHRAGLVHGRMSPDHVFIDAADRVRIGGFTRSLSRASGYLAPEVITGSPATARSDQFAACVVLWEALAKTRPFVGSTPGALAVAMQVAPHAPDRSRIYAVLARGLALDPDRRWATTDALRAALASPQRLGRAAVIALVLVALAALALALR